MNRASIKNIIGTNIRNLRRKRGISQDHLSKLADVSLNTIVKIESGRNKNPTIVTLAKIAASVGASVEALIR
jgi:transcriptional regulator with XRE-family HTH domain